MSNEIILYQSEKLTERIEVRLENETVWLNRQQMSFLFGRDIKTIGKHINNVFEENELVREATVANFATVQNEGGRLVDETEVYHLGASLKDLGKKPVVSEVEPWFAFSKLDKSSVDNILKAIYE